MWKSNDQQWKSLEPKKKIFRTSIFAVCSERFQSLRTGAELDFITLSSWDWVNVIARTEDGKILLIRQFRPGTMQNEIEIPGGCIDPSDPSPEAGCFSGKGADYLRKFKGHGADRHHGEDGAWPHPGEEDRGRHPFPVSEQAWKLLS